jgi:hypothetical protein
MIAPKCIDARKDFTGNRRTTTLLRARRVVDEWREEVFPSRCHRTRHPADGASCALRPR